MLEDAGVDNVTDVWIPPVTTGCNIVVQIHKRYRGHAQQVANALWGTSAGQWFFKNVMVVEEDIHIRNQEALDWAMGFRVNAAKASCRLSAEPSGRFWIRRWRTTPSMFPDTAPEAGPGC